MTCASPLCMLAMLPADGDYDDIEMVTTAIMTDNIIRYSRNVTTESKSPRKKTSVANGA